MTLIKLETEQLDERKIKELRQICWWINNQPDTDIYVLEVDDDIKSVFVIKRFGQVISTTKEMDFGTKKDEQGKGFASIGFELLFSAIRERKDIKEVYIQAFNPLTAKMTSKLNLPNDGMGTSIIHNPNFDQKYDDLCEIIRSGNFNIDEVVNFCGNDSEMLSTSKKWLKVNNSQIMCTQKNDNLSAQL